MYNENTTKRENQNKAKHNREKAFETVIENVPQIMPDTKPQREEAQRM